MEFHTDEEAKRLEIWVPFSSKYSYRDDAAYQEAVREYKKMGYEICTFVGGSNPLLPAISELLSAQTETGFAS